MQRRPWPLRPDLPSRHVHADDTVGEIQITGGGIRYLHQSLLHLTLPSAATTPVIILLTCWGDDASYATIRIVYASIYPNNSVGICTVPAFNMASDPLDLVQCYQFMLKSLPIDDNDFCIDGFDLVFCIDPEKKEVDILWGILISSH
ncbi:hypothetical protein B296_00040721 [Ensete ventricosum]|uniref:Uncharacterized protein n=1 Tax=Ensete ventricosum TaxID=4639 RepID=A0A426XE11_ENSVE|nr:hypothetical protein B296_00040721 [Ensete ventricosum]